jgi:putative Mn2+ efflux pump MntP
VAWYTILLVALGLGTDAMSVCMAVGVKWHGPRQMFRLSWHMGLFQFLMPLAGFFAGRELAGLLSAVGKPLAGLLVIAVGAKMLYEAMKSHPGAVAARTGRAIQKTAVKGERHTPADPTRGWSLVLLSVATSVDALVVGFSLGLGGQGAIVWPSLVIGLVAAAMSLTGVAIGRRAGLAFGRRAEIVGAVLLIGLGLSFLGPMIAGWVE